MASNESAVPVKHGMGLTTAAQRVARLRRALKECDDPVQQANLQCDLEQAMHRASRVYRRMSRERAAETVAETMAGYSKPWLEMREAA